MYIKVRCKMFNLLKDEFDFETAIINDPTDSALISCVTKYYKNHETIAYINYVVDSVSRNWYFDYYVDKEVYYNIVRGWLLHDAQKLTFDGSHYHCPRCNAIIGKYAYCKYCGQPIDLCKRNENKI